MSSAIDFPISAPAVINVLINDNLVVVLRCVMEAARREIRAVISGSVRQTSSGHYRPYVRPLEMLLVDEPTRALGAPHASAADSPRRLILDLNSARLDSTQLGPAWLGFSSIDPLALCSV